MGVGSSGENNYNPFVKTYLQERKEVRKKLILKFIEEPSSKEILDNIRDLRSLIVQNRELCATSRREYAHKYDCSATCMEGAEVELLRLFKIFERGRYLKSAAGRDKGSIACPYGHIMKLFDECPDCYPTGSLTTCQICDNKCKNGGYHCEYCEYDLCDVCCVVYCAEGHAMKLWTLGEGDYCCSVCKTEPITSGYHCEVCIVDICDLCSYKPGRLAVQEFQLREMNDLIDFMKEFVVESWTAKLLVERHTLPETRKGYMLSTCTLHDYVYELRTGKASTQEQVEQYRIWEEVCALRLEIAKENNAVARRELKNVGNFTRMEITRLKRVIAVSARARSVFARRNYYVGCPVGHYAAPFVGVPPAWFQLDRPPLCSICERIADSGCYCPICEYPLCDTCTNIYCFEAHRMKMWTEPEIAIDVQCLLCKKHNITSGYHCDVCNEDMCDECTNKEGRELLRLEKCKELNRLCALILKYKDRSDLAFSYKDKHIPYITDMVRLKEFIIEMRGAMLIAERQHRYYTYICKMKSLKRRITKHAGLCASAQRELEYKNPYNFKNKREVKRELDRLKNTIDTQQYLRSVYARSKCEIACPMGHCLNFEIYDNGLLINTAPDLLQKRLETERIKYELMVAAGDLDASALPPLPIPVSNNIPMDGILEGNENEIDGDGMGMSVGLGSGLEQLPECPEDSQSLLTGTDEPPRPQESISAIQSQGQSEGQDGQSHVHLENIDMAALALTDDVIPASVTASVEDSTVTTFVEEPPIDVSMYLSEEELSDRFYKCYVCNTSINNECARVTKQKMKEAEEDAFAASMKASSMGTATGTGTVSLGSTLSPPYPPTRSLSALSMVSGVSNVSGGGIDEGSIPPPQIAGHYCAFCDYSLCNTCCTIYCRQGHACTLWTFPEARDHQCDICYTNELTAGYHCNICDVDICDICTTKDTRNVLLMIPKRDYKKIYQYLQENKLISKIAYEYLKQHTEEKVHSYVSVMSVLCEQLRHIKNVQILVNTEVANYQQKFEQKKYGFKSNDI